MSKNTPPPTTPAPPPPPAAEAGFSLPADPHAGMGGSYLIHPETGARELIARTQTKGQPHGN